MNVKRFIFNELRNQLQRNETTILIGARQVGKTHLLRQIQTFSEEAGKKTAYYNLEIPEDLLHFRGTEQEIFQKLTRTAEVILIDEFHYLKNASHLFKAVFDSKATVKIFASASSSLAIHKHLKESLAGRRHIVKIFPLSVREYKESGLSFEKILVEGSLPGLLHEEGAEARQAHLRDLIETFILKDVKSLLKEENIRAFNHLLFLLAEYQGSLISVAGLAREIGLTARTIEKYLQILEQTYVCYPCPSFSTNLANELKKSRKYYFYDLGIRNALIKNFEYDLGQRKDRGALLESFVFQELVQKVSANTSIYFWRTQQKAEVDFVKVTNRRPVPIEVKTSLKDREIPAGMRAFLDRYPDAREAYVVTDNLTGETPYKKTPVKFINWKDADTL